MTPPPPSRAPRVLTAFAILALALLGAAALRLHLAWKIHVPTLDSAIPPQMALDILGGRHHLFFAGQSYLGALESYLMALTFLVLPVTRVTMTLVPIACALAWVLATYAFFRRDYGPLPALAAALVPAFPGWQALWYTTAPYGGYPETYLLGLLLLLLARPFIAPAPPFTPTRRHALALALLTGLSLWVNLQILPYLAAAALAGLLALRQHPTPFRPWLAYLAIPAAAILAFLPQFLAEPSHVQPPLFDGLTLGAIAKSIRALWRHDLRHLLLWTYPPAALHHLVALALVALVAAAAILAYRRRRSARRATPATLLVLATLAAFALTYFPHPMSGFIPRYLIAPTTLLLSWALAECAASARRPLRLAAYALALLLVAYNTYGAIRTARLRAPPARQTLDEFTRVIQAARAAGHDAVLHAGSETEGYDAARLTLLAHPAPLFASAYSDRFLDHQLAWEFGQAPAWLARARHLPYIAGSYAALSLPLPPVTDAPPYVLIPTPSVPRHIEHSILPDTIAHWPAPPRQHPLFDRTPQTTWPPPAPPDTPPDAPPPTLTLQFDRPIRLSGLRAWATHPTHLPSSYLLRVQQPDGTWITAQDCPRRLAGSYLSADRLYLRGHHPWLDLRIPPTQAIALEWTLRSLPENPTPPQLDELYVLATPDTPWPAPPPLLPAIQAIADTTSATRLIAERGILRALHLEAARAPAPPPLPLPLPYNPRFARTQPDIYPLPPGRHLLILEQTYAPDARALFTQASIPILHDQPHPPYQLIAIEIPAPPPPPITWQGFRPIPTPPPP